MASQRNDSKPDQDPEDLFRQGLYLSDEGFLQKAEQCFRRAISINDQPLYCVHLAALLQDRGDHEEAAKLLEHACLRDSAPSHHGLLASSLVELARYQEAIAAIECIPVGAREVQHLHVLGVAQYWQGMKGEARQTFEEAVRMDPRFPEARYHLALVLIDCDLLEEAEQMLRSAVEETPGRSLFLRELGRVLALQGDYDACHAVLAKALASDPSDSMIVTYLGHCHLARRQSPEAEKMYRMALDLEPTLAEASEALIHLLESQGRNEDALKVKRGQEIKGKRSRP